MRDALCHRRLIPSMVRHWCLHIFCVAICVAAPCDPAAPDGTCAAEQALAEPQGLVQTYISKAKKQVLEGKKNSDRKKVEKDNFNAQAGVKRRAKRNQRQHTLNGDARMNAVQTYDYIVVGAGTGGMAAARTLADRGANVAVFEGGTDESYRLMRYSWQEPGTENALGEPNSYYMPAKVFSDKAGKKPIGDGPFTDQYAIPYAVGGTSAHYHGANFWYDEDIKQGLEMDESELPDVLSTIGQYVLPSMRCGTVGKNMCGRATHNISTLRPRFIVNRPVPYNVCMSGKCKKDSGEDHADSSEDTCDVNLLTLNEKHFTSFNKQMKNWFRASSFYEYQYRGNASETVDIFTEKEVIGLAVDGSFACAQEWKRYMAHLKDPNYVWRGCQAYTSATSSGTFLTLDGVRIKDRRMNTYYDVKAKKAVILASGVMGDASLLWPIMGEYTWVDQTILSRYTDSQFQCDAGTAFGSTVHLVRCFNKTSQTTYDCPRGMHGVEAHEHSPPLYLYSEEQASKEQRGERTSKADHEEQESLQCGVDDRLPTHIDYKTETRGVYMYYTGCKVSGKDRWIDYFFFNSDPRIEGVVKHDTVESPHGEPMVTFKALINEDEASIVDDFRNQTKFMFSKLDQRYVLPSDIDEHFDWLKEHGASFQIVHWTGGFGDEIRKSQVKGFTNFFVGDALANRGVTHSWTSFTARSAGVVAAQRAFKQFGSSAEEDLTWSANHGVDPHVVNHGRLHVTGSMKGMPLIGFGTCCRASAKGPPLIKSASLYLNNFGRLIDTAQMYENHQDLAKAIRDSGVSREDLWVTSKLDTRGDIQNERDAMQNVDWSLEELGLDYVDLMLIHGAWENSLEVLESIWKGLITAKAAGKVRNIGVSNFNLEELKNLQTKTGVLPAVHQIEYHPWVPKETHDLVKWCQDQGIAVTAYGSLGGQKNGAKSEAAQAIAEKYELSSAQVLLSWALSKGVAVIPGATSEEHIKQNLATPKGWLTEDDMRWLESSPPPEAWRHWHSCKSGCPT